MHARILPLVWEVLSDLRYSKLKRILKVYEYDKEKYGGKRMRGELYSKQGKRKSNLPSLFSLYFSYFSLFNFPFLSIYFYVIWLLSSEWISARILIREMELVIVCTAFLHQLLSMISHSYFAYFAFHYSPVLRTIFLSTCALLYTVHCISFNTFPIIFSANVTCFEKILIFN